MDKNRSTELGKHRPEVEITDEDPGVSKHAKLNNEESKVTFDEDDLEYEREKERKRQLLNQKTEIRTTSPYLATIRRHLLDFDFEKLCSVSLQNLNVYACLVCGKYFQGKGKSTYAYLHALEESHHLFINLHNQKVYCLPDNYEVDNASLGDIKFNLRPYYTREEVDQMDKAVKNARSLDGTQYIPGLVGLNNLKCTDYVNVIIQALCRVTDFRNFFIFHQNPAEQSDVVNMRNLLTKKLADLTRKIWNPKNFKGLVSPHELLQAISLKSNKRFSIIKQQDPFQLLAWFLNEMTKELQKKKNQPTIIQKCFQGEIEILKSDVIRDPEMDDDMVRYKGETSNFIFLTLDPPPILNKQKEEESKNDYVPIFELLKKFNGKQYTETREGNRVKYRIKKLPKYLILNIKRFNNNNFYIEKNPTIINFPLNYLDLKEYLYVPEEEKRNTKYNLVANICHEGQPSNGIYKVHVRNKAVDEWYQVQDLMVDAVESPQLVAISEAYIQIYERIDDDNVDVSQNQNSSNTEQQK